MRSPLLAAACAVLLLPAAASAATPWAGYQPLHGPDDAALGFQFPVFANAPVFDVAPTGAAVAAWKRPDGAVVAARRAPAGTWATTVVSPAGAGSGGSVLDAVIDASGTVTVIWPLQDGRVMVGRAADGAAFTTTQVGTMASPSPTADFDLATSPNGNTVAAWTDNQGIKAVRRTQTGAWSTPVEISSGASGHSEYVPGLAINDAGEGVATWLDRTGTSGNLSYYVRTAALHVGGDWPLHSTLAVGPSAGGGPADPVIDTTGRVTTIYRSGTDVVYGFRAAGNPTVAFEVPSTITQGCSNSATDAGAAVGVDGAGTRTFAYVCNGALRTLTSAAGAQPVGANAQNLGAVSDASPLALDVGAAGQALVATVQGGKPRANRRATASGQFGAAEAFADPEGAKTLYGAGVDGAGDGVALLGEARTAGSTGVVDLSSSILDLTAPTVSIDAPGTAAPGTLVTFTAAVADAFGGLAGTPAWTSTDGGSGAGTTFKRTFASAGTYEVTVAVKDLGGFPATASRTLVVKAPETTTLPPVVTTPVVTTPPAVTPPVAAPPVALPPPPGKAAVKTCRVPKLTGLTLAAAKKKLKAAGCAAGKVTKPRKGSRLVVSRQGRKAKAVVPAGTKVTLTLEARRVKKR